MKKQPQKAQNSNFSHTNPPSESSHNSSQKFDTPLTQPDLLDSQHQEQSYNLENKKQNALQTNNSNFDLSKLALFCTSNQVGENNCGNGGLKEEHETSQSDTKDESKEILLKLLSGINNKEDKQLMRSTKEANMMIDEKKSSQNQYKKLSGDVKQKSGKNLKLQSQDLTEITRKKNLNLNQSMHIQKSVNVLGQMKQQQVQHLPIVKPDPVEEEMNELEAHFQNNIGISSSSRIFQNQQQIQQQKQQVQQKQKATSDYSKIQQLQEIKEIFNNYSNQNQQLQSSSSQQQQSETQPLQQLLFQQQNSQKSLQNNNFSNNNNEQFSNQYESSFNSTPFCTPREICYQSSPQYTQQQQQQLQQQLQPQQLFSHTPQKQDNFGKQQYVTQSSFISTTESTAHDSDNFFTPRLNTTTNNIYQNSANKLLDSSLDTISSDFSHGQGQFFNNPYNSNIYKKSWMNFMLKQQQQQQMKNFIQNQQILRGKRTTQVSDDIQFFHIDISKIFIDGRTTLMIKNIPNKYNQDMLKKEVDQNFLNCYNFLYLPIDFKNGANNGYAFINFIDVKFIPAFMEEFNNKKWRKFNSEKICSIKYARIQGVVELERHFQFSSVMNHKDKNLRPLLLANKQLNKIEQILQLQRQQMMNHQQMNQMPIIQENEQLYNNNNVLPQYQSQVNNNNFYYPNNNTNQAINYQQNFNFSQNFRN